MSKDVKTFFIIFSAVVVGGLTLTYIQTKNKRLTE